MQRGDLLGPAIELVCKQTTSLDGRTQPSTRLRTCGRDRGRRPMCSLIQAKMPVLAIHAREIADLDLPGYSIGGLSV